MLAAVSASLEEIAFDASVRALDHQEGTLAELRARTGVLLAASSLAVAFLGVPAARSDRPLALLGALGAFGVSIGASGWVLVPRSAFTFSITGAAVFQRLYPYRHDSAEIYRRLAYDLARYWHANALAMRSLERAFRLAASSLAVEIALLLVAAGDTLL